MAVSNVLFLTLSGLLLAGAIPQYGQQSAPAPPPPPPSYSSASSSNPSYSSSSSSQGSSNSFQGSSSSFQGSSSGFNSGSSGSSGDLTVQCRASPDSSGKIRYDCSGVNKDAITLKTEHFLWLENRGGVNQNLEVEIPNYNIDEFIRAAYKGLGPQEGAKINILLKKPDVTYNAAKDEPQAQQIGQPSVSVNYQPVDKVSVHYPTQKGYSNGGPSAPPPAGSGTGGQGSSSGIVSSSSVSGGQGGSSSGGQGSGAYSRPQRESGYRYYFVRQ